MNDLLVSVVVTTFKRDTRTLKCAVDSALNQTYPFIELVLIDDNGRGESFQKDNEQLFASIDKIKYIVNDINMGAQYSRNRGVLNADGEFIAFLDDDDYWENNKIAEQIKCFEDKSVGLAFCNGYTIFDDGEKESYQTEESFIRRIDFNALLFRDYIGTTSQVIIRKDCFAKTGLFDLNMPARQDYEMWLRMSRVTGIVGVDKNLFYHRMHRGEQISKNNKKCLIGYERILKMYKHEFQKNKKALSRIHLKMCKHAKGERMIASVVCHLIKALLASPVYATMAIKNKKL